MKNCLECKNVSKEYQGFALKDVSFTLPQGTIMGFVGENGAGKTTTIKAILNLIKRDSGEIYIFGKDNIQEEQEIKNQIGVVFDESYFYEELRPKDIMKIMRNIFETWDDGLFEQYLQTFQIPKAKMIKEFSRGMRMKLAIATALAHRPKLLILDEPTSGLDPVVRNEILDIFLDFIQDEEHAIFMSSHITSDLEKIADYITFIHQGKIVFSESKDELISGYGILKCGREAYGKIDPADIVGTKKGQFGYEVLVREPDAMAKKYPDCVMDHTTIEDIMMFYVKGE